MPHPSHLSYVLPQGMEQMINSFGNTIFQGTEYLGVYSCMTLTESLCKPLLEAREIGHWLREVAALPEDWGSILST